MGLIANSLVVECRDASHLAKFWSAVLSMPLEGGGHGLAVRLEPGSQPGVIFFAETDEKPPANKHVYLELKPAASSTLKEETARLIALGATVVRKRHIGWGVGEVVLADPEGNEFRIASSDLEASAAEARMSEEDRDTGDPFWSDAVPPRRTGTGFAGVLVDPAQSQ